MCPSVPSINYLCSPPCCCNVGACVANEHEEGRKKERKTCERANETAEGRKFEEVLLLVLCFTHVDVLDDDNVDINGDGDGCMWSGLVVSTPVPGDDQRGGGEEGGGSTRQCGQCPTAMCLNKSWQLKSDRSSSRTSSTTGRHGKGHHEDEALGNNKFKFCFHFVFVCFKSL